MADGWGGDMGRPPKPIPLRGDRNRQADRDPHDGGTPGMGQLVRPVWVREAAAVAAWDEAVAWLRDAGLESAADTALLGGYCVAVAKMVEAVKVLDESRVVTVQASREGPKVVGNPAGREFDRYFKIVRAGATQFGFTPSARTRIERAADEADETVGVGPDEVASIVSLVQSVQASSG